MSSSVTLSRHTALRAESGQVSCDRHDVIALRLMPFSRHLRRCTLPPCGDHSGTSLSSTVRSGRCARCAGLTNHAAGAHFRQGPVTLSPTAHIAGRRLRGGRPNEVADWTATPLPNRRIASVPWSSSQDRAGSRCQDEIALRARPGGSGRSTRAPEEEMPVCNHFKSWI
jgi:hypothetical protein